MHNPKFGDLVAFVLLNKGDTFTEYEGEYQIALKMKDSLDKGLLYYSYDGLGRIDGMIMAEKREESKVIFVIENLALSLKNLKAFARRAKKDFEGYELRWYKNGILKTHNTEHIYKKLTI